MKIHIVKKGDTLWKIAEMYDVDFEELKQMNAHLAHPDMIMPGMKIRIPVHKKETKKEHIKSPKEQSVAPKKEIKISEQQPKKEEKKPQQTKPIEKVKEDDHKDHIHIQPVIPFEQQKSPSLSKNTMPKMPAMPELPHIAPMKEEVKEEQKSPKKLKEKPKEKPVKKNKEEKKEEVESFPLTSHGCHCYCGTCTPMHFAGAQMVPQQQQMQMMHSNHGCGCQQGGMFGNYMHPPMIQGAYMPYPHMHHMYPAHYPMMDGNLHAMHTGMHHPMGQPLFEPGTSNDHQWSQQGHHASNQNWQREEQEHQTEHESTHIRNEEPIGNTYPPMYGEESTFYSYPDPPEISEE